MIPWYSWIYLLYPFLFPNFLLSPLKSGFNHMTPQKLLLSVIRNLCYQSQWSVPSPHLLNLSVIFDRVHCLLLERVSSLIFQNTRLWLFFLPDLLLSSFLCLFHLFFMILKVGVAQSSVLILLLFYSTLYSTFVALFSLMALHIICILTTPEFKSTALTSFPLSILNNQLLLTYLHWY